MDGGEQVALILNGNDQEDENVNLTWQDNLSFNEQNSSENEHNETAQSSQSLSDSKENNESIERDLAFIRKHAADADPDFLHSLLVSQMDNPNRLETMMSEVLDIPNAIQLIEEYRKNFLKVGEKRSTMYSEPDLGENKKKRSSESDSYLNKIREMFPDVDGLFLLSECQQLESWDDCTRFINTVMISGVYPKWKTAELTPANGTPKQNNFVGDNAYRTADTYSSEEEVSSSGLSESPKRRRQAKKNRNSSSSTDSSPHFRGDAANNHMHPEIVDLVSDNTEPYDPPDEQTLQELYNSNLVKTLMEIDNSVATSWEVQLDEDVDNILANKFGPSSKGKGEVIVLDRPDSPRPGPSGLQKQNSLPKALSGDSSNANDSFIAENTLEEMMEGPSDLADSGTNAVDDFQRPSTSKGEGPNQPATGSGKTSDVVSSPEVSTTTQPAKVKNGSVVEVIEEADESSKVSEEWLEEQTASLIRIFPNADPLYIRNEVANMDGTPEAINEFVVSKLDRNDMPTRADYEKRLELQELQNRYTKNFSIEDFLKAVPEPWTYFTRGNRDCKKYREHSLCYLKSAFRKHYVKDIVEALSNNGSNLYVTFKQLTKAGVKRRTSRRSEFECNISRPTTIDIQFLQEVAFIENEEKIMDYLEGEKIARQIKFDEAKRTGSLMECQCCFDTEVMVEDIVYCPKDHSFCKDCIVKCVEVEMGNGKCKFECLTNCDEKFTLASLQSVLKPELFSKVIQVVQLEEIRAAEIEDLVQCPFCNYATIMPPEEKVMTCLNPECLKESCRLCKELNHVPLRCDEVEKSEEVKMRTYIENKMTEALVRTCYNCGKKFVKEDGCNKMTCTCGAQMCYICRQRVSGYSHFNGLGGSEYHKCPLYSTNDELHVDLVKKVGEEAKAEILQANPQTKLLHDPTAIMPERANDGFMPGMHVGAGLHAGLRAFRGILNPDEDSDSDGEDEIQQVNDQANDQANGRANDQANDRANDRANHRNRNRRRRRPQGENEGNGGREPRDHNRPHRPRQWDPRNQAYLVIEHGGVDFYNWYQRNRNFNHPHFHHHHHHHHHNHNNHDHHQNHRRVLP